MIIKMDHQGLNIADNSNNLEKWFTMLINKNEVTHSLQKTIRKCLNKKQLLSLTDKMKKSVNDIISCSLDK